MNHTLSYSKHIIIEEKLVMSLFRTNLSVEKSVVLTSFDLNVQSSHTNPMKLVVKNSSK